MNDYNLVIVGLSVEDEVVRISNVIVWEMVVWGRGVSAEKKKASDKADNKLEMLRPFLVDKEQQNTHGDIW